MNQGAVLASIHLTFQPETKIISMPKKGRPKGYWRKPPPHSDRHTRRGSQSTTDGLHNPHQDDDRQPLPKKNQMQPDTEERLQFNGPRNKPLAQSNLPADVLDYKPQHPQATTELMGTQFKKPERRKISPGQPNKGIGPSVIYHWCENSCDMQADNWQ